MTGLPYFDERGHLDEEGVALYVDALRLERTERLPEALREHVAGCQECRVDVTGLYSLLADQPIEASHPTLGKKSSAWRIPAAAYRIAAVIVAAIGILTVLYLLEKPAGPAQKSPEVASGTPRQTDTTTATEPVQAKHATQQDIAANYSPYEELEGLIGSELRGESFQVISPGERLTDRRAVVFSWQTTGNGPWTVVLLDNRGRVVKERETRSTPLVLEGPFRPGLYYWKVIRDDELAHVGKFRVD